MDYDDHCTNLGRLWGNIQSLEVTLRLFLTQATSETQIRNRYTIGILVGKHYDQLANDEQSLYSVDKSVVDVRNALAHGLVSGGSEERFPLTLLHEDLEAVMTVEWFGGQRSLAQKQVDRILACGRKRWQSPWWA